MADPRDVETVATKLRAMSDGDKFPINVRDDADEIAAVALDAMAELPRRAKEVRATRNG